MTRLRQGRRAGRTLYEQTGPAPSDDDLLVGMVDTPELAAEIVAAVNTARAKNAGEDDPELESLRRLRDDLATAIWVDPDRQGGAACIGGTRVTADTIALFTADGDVPPDDVQRYYPNVTPEAARVAAWFQDRYLDLGLDLIVTRLTVYHGTTALTVAALPGGAWAIYEGGGEHATSGKVIAEVPTRDAAIAHAREQAAGPNSPNETDASPSSRRELGIKGDDR